MKFVYEYGLVIHSTFFYSSFAIIFMQLYQDLDTRLKLVFRLKEALLFFYGNMRFFIASSVRSNPDNNRVLVNIGKWFIILFYVISIVLYLSVLFRSDNTLIARIKSKYMIQRNFQLRKLHLRGNDRAICFNFLTRNVHFLRVKRDRIYILFFFSQM